MRARTARRRLPSVNFFLVRLVYQCPYSVANPGYEVEGNPERTIRARVVFLGFTLHHGFQLGQFKIELNIAMGFAR